MKKALLVSCLIFSLFGLAQVVELTVQTGHSASINTVKFSPDDKLLATAGDDNKIVLWDFFTEKQYDVLLGHKAKVTGVVFTPEGKKLYSSSLDSTIKVWDVYSGECLQTIDMKMPVGGVALSPDGKVLLVAGKRMSAINLNDQTTKNYEFSASKLFTSVCFSKDGKYIAFGGESEDFAYIVDIKEGILIKKLVAQVQDLEFDDEAGTLFYSTTDGKLFEHHVETNDIKGSTTDWMLNAFHSLEFNASTVFAANGNGEVRMFNRERKWFKSGVLKGIKGKIHSIDLSHNGKYLATAGDNRTVVIWDIEKGRAVKSMTGLVHPINDIAFSKDGAEILVGYANGIVRKTNLISNQTIINRIKPKSEIAGTKSNYSVVRIESFTNDTAVFTMLYQKNSLVYEGVYDAIEEYKVTWNLKENMLEMEKIEDQGDKIETYIKDLKAGKFHDNYYFLDTSLVWSKSDSLGVYVRSEKGDLIACLAKNDKVCFKTKTRHSDIVTAVAINPRYNYVATASWDGMIRFWDLITGNLLTIYGAFGNGQFVYIDQAGYYFSSKDALDYIGFKLNNKVFSFEQFDLKYNRPDIVAKSLPYFNEEYVSAYYGAYKKRLSKLGIEEEKVAISENLPKIQLNKVFKEGEIVDELELDISCIESQFALDKLHLKVNGVPEFGRFGKQLKGKEHEEKYTLKLNPGTNYIQLHITNTKGVSSYKQSFKIESHKKKTTTNLYLITIGVSDYQQEQYKLSYARKDAEDIELFFSEQELYFDEIYTKSLLDKEVTKENVTELENFVQLATENDVVIFFAAGHGVLDVNLDYYFASHDMDFMDPAGRGIPYEMFENLMDITKSRKKVMFIDACHSGEIDKDEVIENIIAEEENGELVFRGTLRSVSNKYDINSFDLSRSLFADMRLNNGSTVVSSAGGAEFAIEGDQWNNGVFTFTFLMGLRDKKADLNGDKVIMLSELQQYIQFEVNRITNGMQTPTSRVENLNNDFRMR